MWRVQSLNPFSKRWMNLLRKDACAAPALVFHSAPGIVHLTRAQQIYGAEITAAGASLACHTAPGAPLGSTELCRGTREGKSEYLVVIPFLQDQPSALSAPSPTKLKTVPVAPVAFSRSETAQQMLLIPLVWMRLLLHPALRRQIVSLHL